MKRGFTLIELLVVVLIIGILAAVALPQYNSTVEKARASEALIAVKAMHNAQQHYFLANDEYTNNVEDLAVSPPGDLTTNCTAIGASGPNCYKNDYFYYAMRSTPGAVFAGRIGSSPGNTNTPGDYLFIYSPQPLTNNGITYSIECVDTRPSSGKGGKICQSLGATYRDGNASWKHYAFKM